jgi:hypothetical protein
LLQGKGKRPTIALITPSIWGMSVKIEVTREICGKVQMVSLGGVKQTLHDNAPWLYEKAHRFYQMTPYVKHRNARLARIQDDLSKNVRARFKYELRIVGEYLNDDWTVRHGPFSGMKFAPVPPPNSFLTPKVIGCYESQIHQWINDAIAYRYDRILDIGCAEGYYAVGFALKSRNSTVYAYDIDQRSRGNTAALARLNSIAEKVHVRGPCTFDEFNREVSNRTLIFCDIEGSEFDLLRPDLAPALSRVDLIVEMHDFCRPGVTETLVQRFLPSHRIEIVYHCAKYAAEFPVLKAVPAREHALLLEEGRPRNQCWMRLLAKQSGAIEPVIEWWPAGEVPVETP